MSLEPSPILQFAFVTFTSVFFLVDPFAAIPAFLAMTDGANATERRRTAKRASWTCFLVLAGFALAGGLIFKVFGITLPAFRIAGGVILLLIGLDMLQAKRSHTQEVPAETQEGVEKEDASVIPLGIPMLAGPGTISTVMVLMSQPGEWWHVIVVFLSIAVTSLLSFVVLSGADRVAKILGETGIRILMRMMGLLLVAIAVQFVINGMMDLHVIPRPEAQ
jgi:multiple antibiotic resistance protein